VSIIWPIRPVAPTTATVSGRCLSVKTYVPLCGLGSLRRSYRGVASRRWRAGFGTVPGRLPAAEDLATVPQPVAVTDIEVAAGAVLRARPDGPSQQDRGVARIFTTRERTGNHSRIVASPGSSPRSSAPRTARVRSGNASRSG